MTYTELSIMPAHPEPQSPNSLPSGVHTVGLERLLALSDGIFAVAITLLVLDIHLPKFAGVLSNQQLLDDLVELWPKLFAYLFSFGVVALFWVKHQVSFRYIRAYDIRLIILNLLLLLVVSFIPFPTAVMSEHRNNVATALYSATMASGFLLSGLIWLHSTGNQHLVSADLDPGLRRSTLLSTFAAAAVFALAAVVVMVDLRWGRLLWLLLIPATNPKWWHPGRAAPVEK